MKILTQRYTEAVVVLQHARMSTETQLSVIEVQQRVIARLEAQIKKQATKESRK